MHRPMTQHVLALVLFAALSACGGGGATATATETGTVSAPPAGDTPGQSVSTFTLALSDDKIVLLQGATTTLTVTVSRASGFDGAVQVTLDALPTGVSASSATIASGATSARLTVSTLATAPHSLPTAVKVVGNGGVVSASNALTVTVRGLPGAMDTSFAGGKIVTPVGSGDDYANAVVVQTDGKLILVGSSAVSNGTSMSLVRYQRDGALDTAFGNDGKVITGVGSRDDVATASAVQADGKIVVVGRSLQTGSGYDFAVLRYNSDGSLDNSFGTAGKVVTDFNHQSDIARAVVIQADGKIVVGGEAMLASNTTGVDFALARYNSDGSLDSSFGNGGKLTTALKASSGADVIRSLALQTVAGEQRILAAGGGGDFMVARYTANGNLDTGFASGGKIVGLFNSSIGAVNAVTVLPDGKAVLAGQINHDFAVVQLTPAGALDSGFGVGGKAVNPVSASNWDEAMSVVRQADGKLLVGGWVYTSGSSGDFAIQRYTAAGVQDGDFGTHGNVITPMAAGTLNDLAHGLVLQADERVPTVRVIQAGEATSGNHNFALTRYWL